MIIRVHSTRESGLFIKWTANILLYNRDKTGLINEDISEDLFKDFKQLGINSVFDIFYLLVLGILMSLVVFMLEYFNSYYSLNKVQHPNQLPHNINYHFTRRYSFRAPPQLYFGINY